MCLKEFEGGHLLNTLHVDAQWGWIPLVFPEVNHHLLIFAGVEEQVVFRTPTCQLVDLVPVRSLIPSADEAMTVVSSANLMTVLEGWMGVQSCVYREYRRGISTQP